MQRLLICVAVVCILFVSDFYTIFGNDSRFFYSFCSQYTGDIYLLFFGIIYSWGILSAFDQSIDKFGRLYLLQSEEAYRVYYFLASCMSRMCFSIVVSMDYFVYIGFILIAPLSGIYHIRFGLFVCISFSRYFESLEFYCVF